MIFQCSQLIRVAQRITRSATNREIAGSNPVTDNEISFAFRHIHEIMNFVEDLAF